MKEAKKKNKKHMLVNKKYSEMDQCDLLSIQYIK